MIPVEEALETTGGADLIARTVLKIGTELPICATLGIFLVTTVILSGVINNAATVVLMAPIGIRIAVGLVASIGPFLMTIAVSASCAFFTPIVYKIGKNGHPKLFLRTPKIEISGHQLSFLTDTSNHSYFLKNIS